MASSDRGPSATVDQTRQLEQAMRDLGLTVETHARIRSAPSFEEAVVRLDALKVSARRRFHKLALELHPDRTGGDPAKTERFRTLAQVMDQLDRMQIGRPPAPRPVVRIVFSAGPGFAWSSVGSNSGASTTTSTTYGGWSPFDGVRSYVGF